MVKVPVTSSKELPAGLGLCSARTINLPAGLGLCSANSSNLSADVGLCTASRNSNKMFQLIVRCVFTVRFKQQYQSQLQQDLVDLSLLNAFLIATLNSISIKAKANSAKLIDTLTSHQSVMIHLNNGSSQFAVKYIFSSSSEGAHTACRFIVELDAAAKDLQAVCLPMLASVPTPHLEGAGAQSRRQADSERVQAAQSHSSQMIVNSVSQGAQNPLSILIVGCRYSKIFLYFCSDCTIFCEVEWEHLAFGQNMASGPLFGQNLPMAQPLATTWPLARLLAKTWPLGWPLATNLPPAWPLAKTLPLAWPLTKTLPLAQPLAKTLPLARPLAKLCLWRGLWPQLCHWRGLWPQHGLWPSLWPQLCLWHGLWPKLGLWSNHGLWPQLGLWPNHGLWLQLGLWPNHDLWPNHGLWPQLDLWPNHGLWPNHDLWPQQLRQMHPCWANWPHRHHWLWPHCLVSLSRFIGLSASQFCSSHLSS
jgi:hypothetical protein